MGAAASSLAEALEGLTQYKDNVGTSQDKRHTTGDSSLHLYFPYSLLSCRGKFQSPLLSANPSSCLFSRSRFFHEDALKKSQASIYINRGKVWPTSKHLTLNCLSFFTVFKPKDMAVKARNSCICKNQYELQQRAAAARREAPSSSICMSNIGPGTKTKPPHASSAVLRQGSLPAWLPITTHAAANPLFLEVLANKPPSWFGGFLLQTPTRRWLPFGQSCSMSCALRRRAAMSEARLASWGDHQVGYGSMGMWAGYINHMSLKIRSVSGVLLCSHVHVLLPLPLTGVICVRWDERCCCGLVLE